MKAHRHIHPESDAGFTIVEVLVAAVLLVIGAVATLSLLDTSTRATSVSKQRDVANALAQEMIERAQGGRYTLANNDMTDVVAGTGPADRMRSALDPDSDAASSAVTPATTPSGTLPTLATQTWTLRRKSTTYTVSYRACTASDTYQQVVIQGPYDCNRSTTNPNPPNTTTSGSCSLGVIPATQVNPADPGTLTVRLQLLGVVGLNVCVGALSSDLAKAVCTLAGSSTVLTGLTNTLLGTSGVLTGLLGGVGSGATVGLCTPTQIEQPLAGVQAGIATTTRLAVTVAWQDFEGQPHSLAQSAVVRRPS